jgi:pimeloyl-ACP methyl ester carboxylesterase
MQRVAEAVVKEPRSPWVTKPVRSLGRGLIVPLLAASVAWGCGGDEPDPRTDRESGPRDGAPVTVGLGKLVETGTGRSLYVYCVGSGTPTVVLEAGFGGTAHNWDDVHDALGRTTRTCAYDRAGLGHSLSIPGVHDAADEIEDLERLLDHGEIEPPYVLVGHSYGGLLARLFARDHPDEAAGVVLVDAMGPDATRRQLARWPESLAPARRRDWAQPVIDGVDLRSSERLASAVRTLGDTPLVVVTAGQHREETADLPRRLVQLQAGLWGTLQGELARLSSDHVHVVAQRSGHFVQDLDGQPQVVIRAVRSVVRAARDNTQLPPCEDLFSGPDVRCRS